MIDILQKIQNTEINYRIECFYDAGFTVSLGDDMNGWVWTENYATLVEAVNELIKEAKRYKNVKI